MTFMKRWDELRWHLWKDEKNLDDFYEGMRRTEMTFMKRWEELRGHLRRDEKNLGDIYEEMRRT